MRKKLAGVTVVAALGVLATPAPSGAVASSSASCVGRHFSRLAQEAQPVGPLFAAVARNPELLDAYDDDPTANWGEHVRELNTGERRAIDPADTGDPCPDPS